MFTGSQFCSWWMGVAENQLIQTFQEVLVTCKNEEDPFKNEGARVVITDLPL